MKGCNSKSAKTGLTSTTKKSAPSATTSTVTIARGASGKRVSLCRPLAVAAGVNTTLVVATRAASWT